MTACTGDCTIHDRLCERDPGHDGNHECVACPGHRRRQWEQAIADRIAAHRIYCEVIETTPDID